MSVNSKMTAIADAIRAKTGGTDALTLDGIAAAIPEVYAAGEKSAYDAFWDSYQSSSNYYCKFAGDGWTENTFKPKHDIIPTDAGMLFYNNQIKDLVSVLEKCGVILDLSKCTELVQTFTYTFTNRIGIVDARNSKRMFMTFLGSKVVTIEKIMLSDITNVQSNVFMYCTNLENMIIEGTIAYTGFDTHWSTKLSRESITSIVNALSDTTSGMTVTFSQTAVDAAFTDDEWATLIAAKPNWTFTLA